MTDLDTAASLATFNDGRDRQQYEGLTVWKLQDDLDRYRAVVAATGPEVIVETGTRHGGSAVWFARELGVDVVSIDFAPSPPPPTFGLPITYLRADTLRASTISEVGRLVAGRRTMVSLDSDHHAPHVRLEIRAYGPLVSEGCYLVVEDGIFDLAPPAEARRGGIAIPEMGGPLRAVEVLAGDPQWTRDLDVEGMSPLSHFPAGWWRRG